MINLGFIFFVYMALPVIFILIKLMSMLASLLEWKKLSDICNGRLRKMQWNNMIRFVNETYILVTVSAILNLYATYSRDLNFGVNFYITVGFTVLIVIGYPLFIVLNYMCRDLGKLQDKEFKSKYDEIYREYDIEKHKKFALIMPLTETYRMFTLSILLCLLIEHMWL